MANDLARAGFNVRQMGACDLKGRHVNALLRVWRDANLSVGTIKNRMAVLRWWAEKANCQGAIKTNTELGIEKRVYVANVDKSRTLDGIDLGRMNAFVACSLQLQQEFGLRREEAMKFQPGYALGGAKPHEATMIQLKGSWTKGGRERVVPITNERQREVLAKALALAGRGSMIAPSCSYKAHLSLFETQTAAQGLGNTHGLRHGYAQRRYIELTGGMLPPALLQSARSQKKTDEERAAQLGRIEQKASARHARRVQALEQIERSEGQLPPASASIFKLLVDLARRLIEQAQRLLERVLKRSGGRPFSSGAAGAVAPVPQQMRRLSAAEQALDLAAREQITQELGHSRVSITSNYLGSWRSRAVA